MISIQKIELTIPGLGELRTEARDGGYDFVETLINEWTSGANRFEAPGEILYGHRQRPSRRSRWTHHRPIRWPARHRPHPSCLCPIRMAQQRNRQSTSLCPRRTCRKELPLRTPPRRKRSRSTPLRKYGLCPYRQPCRNPHPSFQQIDPLK